MRTMMSSVSAVAIALMIGTTAMAASSTLTTDQSSTTSQGTSAKAATGASATMPQSAENDTMMRDRLNQAGVKNPQQVTGYIVTAQGPDGQPVVMVVGPENLKGAEVKNFDPTDFDKKLTDAGFKNPTRVEHGRMMRGDMDKNVALLVVGQPGWVKSEGTGSNAASYMAEPDQAKLKDQVGKAGINGADQFGGQVLRVDNDGQPAFLIIAPSDLKTGQKVDVSSSEQSKLDESGFSTMDQTSDIVALQGKIGNNPVIIFTGPGLTE